MHEKPLFSSSRAALTIMAAGAALPVISSQSLAQEGYSGTSSLAQREIIRRQEAVTNADRLFMEGREAYEKQDYQMSVDKYRQAVGVLPKAPALADRRQSYLDHLGDASVALAQKFRGVGKYVEAKQLLENVLSPGMDPENSMAKNELATLDDPIQTNPALTYEYTQNVDEVRRKLYMAQGNYDLAKFDDAKRDYEDVLRIDPFNKAARRGLEKVAAIKSDYFRASYDHTRAELLMQVDQAWELAVPADLPTFDDTSYGESTIGSGVAYITEKLRRIIIPRIDFENTTVEEAIDFLRQRAAELDIVETDPAKKGINFVIQKPRASSIGVADSGLDAVGGGSSLLTEDDPGALRIEELRLRNVPLSTALEYIGDMTKLRYKVDDYAVTLVPNTATTEEFFTRTFRVPPDFVTSLNTGGGDAAAAPSDPFADDGGGSTTGQLKPRPGIRELLITNGIKFNENSAATLGSGGALLVTNTPSELDKIEQLVEIHSNKQPKQVKITTKFVEISQENADELGFDWIVSPFGLTSNSLFGTAGTIGSGASKTAADFVSNVGGTAISGISGASDQQVTNIVTGGNRSGSTAINRNSIDFILNNPGRSSQSARIAPGILGLTGLFSDAQVQVIMRGLSQKKGTDLMTAPSVTARSGQKATIEVIREFIYPTEYEPPELPQSVGTTSGVGGVAGGLGSGGGGFPVTPATPTAFETKNTGVTLEVEPTIGENDFVIDLRFLPEIVEFEGFINYGSPIFSSGQDLLGNPTQSVITENRIEMPVFAKRSVTTSLIIYDGYTVAVGGLMREDVQNVEDKVPILGDIPLIGRLFQTKSENRIKSNLIIFVTAQIIDATGRPIRGADSPSVAVSTLTSGGAGLGVLPPPPGLPE